MRRNETQSIGEVLAQFLRESGLEKPILERRVVEQWPQIMGQTVANLTRKVEVREGVLYVHLSSAALRAHLFEVRHELIQKINSAVGDGVIQDVRLL